MPKQKTPWKQELEKLEKNLPDKFDARKFRSCRVKGKYDAPSIKKVCAELGYAGKEEAIVDYLKHYEDKPAPGKRKSVKKKEAVVVEGKALLSKKLYRNLPSEKIEKLIVLLTEIQKENKDKEVAGLKAQKQEIDKRLKDLQAN